MPPLVLPLDPACPDPGVLGRAASVLEQGGILAYPTETLYGLGVDPFQSQALLALCRLKKRSRNQAFSILVRDTAMALEVAGRVSPRALRIMEMFLPGPLTVLLAAANHLPRDLTGGTDKIGVRISSHPMMVPFFERFPAPFTTTSANVSGTDPAQDAGQIVATFPEGLHCVLDAGPIRGVASTVVDLSGNSPMVLREGAIPGEAVLAC